MPFDAELVEFCQLLIVEPSVCQPFLNSLKKQKFVLLTDFRLRLLRFIYGMVVHRAVVGGIVIVLRIV